MHACLLPYEYLSYCPFFKEYWAFWIIIFHEEVLRNSYFLKLDFIKTLACWLISLLSGSGGISLTSLTTQHAWSKQGPWFPTPYAYVDGIINHQCLNFLFIITHSHMKIRISWREFDLIILEWLIGQLDFGYFIKKFIRTIPAIFWMRSLQNLAYWLPHEDTHCIMTITSNRTIFESNNAFFY